MCCDQVQKRDWDIFSNVIPWKDSCYGGVSDRLNKNTKLFFGKAGGHSDFSLDAKCIDI